MIHEKNDIGSYIASTIPFAELEMIISKFAIESNLITKRRIRKYCKKMHNSRYELFVISDGKEIVAFLSLKKKKHHYYVSEFAVKIEYQRKGYGTKLLSAIQTKYPHMPFTLHVRSKNDKAIQLYLKQDYRIAWKLPIIVYYSRPFDRVLLMKKLPG